MTADKKKVLVIGVIGADVHAVGNKILYHAFTEAGFEVVNLGVMVSQEEYIAAAIESDADAIVVSSLYGQGELDCRGMREKCDEAGLIGIPLVVGGNIVIGKQQFEDVERRFKDMGFDRAFPPALHPKPPLQPCVSCCTWTVSRCETGSFNRLWFYIYKIDCRGCGRGAHFGHSPVLHHSPD